MGVEALGSGHRAQPPTKPNIIFILADDLGYGELGCYGQRTIRTPNLDRMAAEGIRFTQFYAGSTVCAPSRSVLMTGQHTGHTTVRGNAGGTNRVAQTLRHQDVTVAKVLQQAGYTTGLVGKWGLGEADSEGCPNKQGFDYFFGFANQTHAHNHYPDFLWRNTEKVLLPNQIVPVGTDGAGYATNRVQYAGDLFAAEASGFIDRHRNNPFFLYYAVTVPHANNERNRALKDGQEVPDYGAYAQQPWSNPLKGQAAMISRLDADVGRLLDHLRQLALQTNTLVLFTSDNGPHKEGGQDPEFFHPNGPLKGYKRDLTDGGIRVPFIAWWPGHIRPGRVSTHVGYFGDFMATATELAGAAVPEALDSLSLVPTLLGRGRQQKHDLLYWEFHESGFSQAVLLDGRWKGIRLKRPDTPIQLYDLRHDIGETNNLADARPKLIKRVTAQMEAARSDSPLWPIRPAR